MHHKANPPTLASDCSVITADHPKTLICFHDGSTAKFKSIVVITLMVNQNDVSRKSLSDIFLESIICTADSRFAFAKLFRVALTKVHSLSAAELFRWSSITRELAATYTERNTKRFRWNSSLQFVRRDTNSLIHKFIDTNRRLLGKKPSGLVTTTKLGQVRWSDGAEILFY